MALLVKDIKLPLNEKESLLSKVTAKTLGIPENAVKGLAIKRISLAGINHFHSCFILSPCFSGYQILIMDFSFRQELLCCRLIHLFPLACKEFIILP